MSKINIIEQSKRLGALEELRRLLLRECPVKYYNGGTGDAVPIEFIKVRIKELEGEKQ